LKGARFRFLMKRMKYFNDSIIAKIFMCDLSLKRESFYSLIRLFLALTLAQL